MLLDQRQLTFGRTIMRDTSRRAFLAIKESGMLSRRRLEALEVLYEAGPLTGQELCHQARVPGLWKRLSELEEMGLARTCGERICTVTGMTVSLWEAVES